jgi:two-component system sensor histidine kinase KdpD
MSNQHALIRIKRAAPYFWACLLVMALTGLGVSLQNVLTATDQALIYLTGVVLVASRWGRGPSFLYSLLSVTGFNFFFIPPLYTFDVYDRSYWLTFLVMIITGFVIADQATRLRVQTQAARKRERETRTLYALTKDLASTRGAADIAQTAAGHIARMRDVAVAAWLGGENQNLTLILGSLPAGNVPKETSVLQWCFEHARPAGRGTDSMPSAAGLYLPLLAVSGAIGVMSVIPTDAEHAFSDEEVSSLQTCSNLLAAALERTSITDMMEKSRLEAEGERLRTTLLSSVSHDLRTPLASITGASSIIADDTGQLPPETIRDLGRSVHKEAERLSHLVTNLLEVTRLESGTVQLNRQPYYVEELIGSTLARLEPMLAKYAVVPQSDEGLPLVLADGVLIEQVLTNLLENAARYTSPGTTITVSAARKGAEVLISVADTGPGIPAGNEKRIFDKFTSISRNDAPKGTGLGLAICASIVKAHEGEIWAENRPQGGAGFYFTLPVANDALQRIKNAANG